MTGGARASTSVKGGCRYVTVRTNFKSVSPLLALDCRIMSFMYTTGMLDPHSAPDPCDITHRRPGRVPGCWSYGFTDDLTGFFPASAAQLTTLPAGDGPFHESTHITIETSHDWQVPQHRTILLALMHVPAQTP